MPSTNPVITVATQPEDGAVQVEVAISLRRRRPKASPAPPIASAAGSPGPRIPRITRLIALAIKFQDLVERGEVRDYADLARLGYVTRARVTQIMNLSLLAPDIQEAFLDNSDAWRARSAITDQDLRSVSKIVDWAGQRGRLDGDRR